ncbi:unnamed protein product [Rotaria sp. Silwood2]|nr:unnamed protein product [Rotaria sp. Silwood2]CAF2837422.1 unnamed protein product [Rotaria sp. Silwood2]CAF3288155.1 unnamed protein product [Rotaria sp. Silwood2]CAF3329579.1 unnamed protein product [Rotaria sp. Silwood2]CAF4138536.1 unnamed protein product [Rotaria sp. Silwood2]
MSSINTTVITTTGPSRDALIVGYYSLTLIIVGTLFNIITLFILCRSKFKSARARPTLHYMRTMAIFDILMLYGWNLDHYLKNIYQIRIVTSSLISCKIISFLSFFAPQSSAWLRVFVCLDRYLSLSRLHRTWFGQSKNVLIIIACILCILLLLNFHFFLFVCYYKANGTITVYSWLYSVYPLWDNVNFAVYNCAPFIFMVIFNSGVIHHLIRLRRTTTIRNSQIQHRSISITLVITTFLFLVMTVPSNVAFSFFPSSDNTLLWLFDCLVYSYHALSFPLYMITFDEFRENFFEMIPCKRNNRRVAPLTRTGTIPPTFAITKTMTNT